MLQFFKFVLRLELQIRIALVQFIVFCACPLFPQVTKITYYWLNSLGKQQKKIAFFVIRKTFNAEAKNFKFLFGFSNLSWLMLIVAQVSLLILRNKS
jgi:hypothetical protein